MKKGCLIVLIILAVLLGAALVSAFVGFRIVNQRFGLRQAPVITHEELATGYTRIRLAVYPERMASFIAGYIPPDVEIPTGAFEVNDVLAHLLPREVALLAHSDVLGRKIRLTLFVNEKRFGPLFREFINTSNLFTQARQVNWTTSGFLLPERGLLYAEGDINIPAAVEEDIFALWPVKSQAPPATIIGGNHAELVIDNRDGDILALAAAIVQANGQSWELARAQQEVSMAIGVIESIQIARLSVNLVDRDTAAIDLRIDSDAERGPGLQFLLSGLALPWLRDFLKNEHGLILEGDTPWNESESAILGSFKLTGLEALITQNIQGL